MSMKRLLAREVVDFEVEICIFTDVVNMWQFENSGATITNINDADIGVNQIDVSFFYFLGQEVGGLGVH